MKEKRDWVVERGEESMEEIWEGLCLGVGYSWFDLELTDPVESIE